MNKFMFKNAVENFYLGLESQGLLDKAPIRKKINNEIYKLKKTLRNGVYIDALWKIYDKDHKLLPYNLSIVCGYMKQGFINEFNSWRNALIEMETKRYVSWLSPNFEYIACEKVSNIEKTQKMSIWDYIADCEYYSFGNTPYEAKKLLLPILREANKNRRHFNR